MKQRIVKRNTNKNLNLTPLYKENIFGDGGSPFDNISSASIGDAGTTAAMQGGGSVGGTFASLEGMFDAGLSNAKLKSTYNIQSDIADNMSLAFGNNMNTNDELMEAWDEYNPMSHISRKDVRGGSTLGRIWNTNMASIKGAEAGWNASKSPYGAIIGGVVGLGTGVAGWITGGKKASRIRDKLNREIDIANAMGYQTLANQTADVAQKNLMRAEGNYVAEGGELNTGLDKRFAGTLMQDIYSNGIPSQNKFAPGGNVNIAVTPTVYTGPDISRLLPYIQKAKAMREEQQLLKEQEQQPIPIRREVQIPEPTAKYTYTPPTEETKQQMRGYVPSDELIDSILKHEGYLPQSSNRLDGIWTIGYGDTDKELNDYYRAHPNEIFPEEEARKRAANRIRTEFLGYAEKYTPNWDKLTGPQKDAIISYIYNVGPGSFKNKHPKLQKALREMNLEEIAANMSAGYYDRSKPGLRKRRDFERLAFYYPEMTTYGVIPEGVTRRSFEPNDSPANKLRYETLNVKQPKTGTVPAIYTKEYLNTMPDENSLMQRGAAIWGFADGGNLFAYGTEGDPPEGVKAFQQTMQRMQAKKNINNLIEQAKINKERKESAEAKVKAAIDKRKKSSRGFTDVTGGVGYDAIDNIIEDAATYGKELGLENEYRNAAAKRTGAAALTALTVPASFGAFGAVPAAAADSYFMAEAAHNIKNNTAGPMDYAMLAFPGAKAIVEVPEMAKTAYNIYNKNIRQPYVFSKELNRAKLTDNANQLEVPHNTIKALETKSTVPTLQQLQEAHNNVLYQKAVEKAIESGETRKWLKDFNRTFARRYHYDPIPLQLSQNPEFAENAVKDLLHRHNRVVRGVSDFEESGNRLTSEEVQAMRKLMKDKGFNPDSKEDRLLFAATTYAPAFRNYGRADVRGFLSQIDKDGNITKDFLGDTRGTLYASNSLGTAEGYTYNKGKAALLEFPFTLGKDRKLWQYEADFPVAYSYRLLDNIEAREDALAKAYAQINNIKVPKNLPIEFFNLPKKPSDMNLEDVETLLNSIKKLRGSQILDRAGQTKVLERAANIIKYPGVEPQEASLLKYYGYKENPKNLKEALDNIAISRGVYGYKNHSVTGFKKYFQTGAGKEIRKNISETKNSLYKELYGTDKKRVIKARKEAEKKYLKDIFKEQLDKEFVDQNSGLAMYLDINMPHTKFLNAGPKFNNKKADSPFSHFIATGKVGDKAANFIDWIDFSKINSEQKGIRTRQHFGVAYDALTRNTRKYGGKLKK